MWETTPEPKTTGPLGRALLEFRKLGWQPLVGWWTWTYPGAHTPVNLALDSQLYVEHFFREELRKQQLHRLRPGGRGSLGAWERRYIEV